MTDPRVSVLLTSFNREKYLPASIESVLAQQFQDFELVIVDDHSSDHSAEIAYSYARQDSRIRVLVNDRNLGDYPNRNRAASFAKGEYIKFHDSDDLMYPHCLAVMVPLMDAEPSAAFGLSLPRRFPGGPAPMLLTPRQSYQREFFGSGMFGGAPSNAIFRRLEFDRLGGFPNVGNASDDLFWLHACARVNVLALPADLFWIRTHARQSSRGHAAARDYTIVVGAAWSAVNSPHCPLDAAERERARSVVAFRLVKEIARDVASRRLDLASLRYRRAGINPLQILRYARPPKLSFIAGTPLDAEGDYIVPRWTAPNNAKDES